MGIDTFGKLWLLFMVIILIVTGIMTFVTSGILLVHLKVWGLVFVFTAVGVTLATYVVAKLQRRNVR